MQYLGVNGFIEQQLNPLTIDDSACLNEVARFVRLNNPVRELVLENKKYEVQNELVGMTLVRAVCSRRQLCEVMVDFWTNHFSVNAGKRRVAFFLPTDNDTLRRLSMDRFDRLLIESARSPSMLEYLDNKTSRANGGRPPNENYAREMMEVHTLGDANAYTEQYVKAAAFVFTGWTYDAGDFRYAFRPDWNRLGSARNAEILGWSPVGEDGDVRNGETLLAHLARHPQTARNVCWKLCRFFIRDDISADDPAVQTVVNTYLSTETSIRESLRTLFSTDAFRQSARLKIKRPNELVYSMLRAVDARFQLDYVQGFSREIKEELVKLDHVTFESPSPKGHPYEASAWIDASAMINRWNLAFRTADNRIKNTSIDYSDYRGDAQTLGQLIDNTALRLLGERLPEVERQHILRHLGLTDGDGISQNVMARLPAIVGLTLASPSFQVR